VEGIGLGSCTSCGSVVAAVPAPEPSAYGAAYYERSYVAFRDERLAFLRSLLARLGDASGRIALDCGCGAGLSLEVLAATGWRAVGIEPSPAGAALAARRSHAVARASASELPTATGVAGAVLLLDVLAHVDDPAAAVREAARALAPGGRILVKTPHRPSWAYRVAARLPGRVGRGLMHLPHQRYAISERALAAMLTAAGFEGIELRPSREAIPLRARLSVSWALKLRVVLAAAFEMFYGMPSSVATGEYRRRG
jgi:2-polyprenyl-6-hydroxyphenyl methylase/3-demethylubiquinone-9 3-methyltransferase